MLQSSAYRKELIFPLVALSIISSFNVLNGYSMSKYILCTTEHMFFYYFLLIWTRSSRWGDFNICLFFSNYSNPFISSGMLEQILLNRNYSWFFRWRKRAEPSSNALTISYCYYIECWLTCWPIRYFRIINMIFKFYSIKVP